MVVKVDNYLEDRIKPIEHFKTPTIKTNTDDKKLSIFVVPEWFRNVLKSRKIDLKQLTDISIFDNFGLDDIGLFRTYNNFHLHKNRNPLTIKYYLPPNSSQDEALALYSKLTNYYNEEEKSLDYLFTNQKIGNHIAFDTDKYENIMIDQLSVSRNEDIDPSLKYHEFIRVNDELYVVFVRQGLLDALQVRSYALTFLTDYLRALYEVNTVDKVNSRYCSVYQLYLTYLKLLNP